MKLNLTKQIALKDALLEISIALLEEIRANVEYNSSADWLEGVDVIGVFGADGVASSKDFAEEDVEFCEEALYEILGEIVEAVEGDDSVAIRVAQEIMKTFKKLW